MKYPIKLMTIALGLVLGAVSCVEKKNNTQEEIQIKTMDSTNKVLKDQTEKLEEQTKKVEASLEKLDKEFDSGN